MVVAADARSRIVETVKEVNFSVLNRYSRAVEVFVFVLLVAYGYVGSIGLQKFDFGCAVC